MSVAIGIPMLIILLVIVIPLLILFIKLCIKKPKIAITLALVPVTCVILVLLFFVSFPVHRRVSHVTYQEAQPIWESSRYQQSTSPIWSEGIEDQFEADVYPSRVSAVRSVSKRIGEQFRHVMIDSQQPDSIVVLQTSRNSEFVEILRDSILKQYPEMRCRIDIDMTPVQQNEVGILLEKTRTHSVHLPQGNDIVSGTFGVTISNQSRKTMITVDFVEKPWVENFSDFMNVQPDKQYIVAKSSESCLAPGEADQQAMEDACVQVSRMLNDYPRPIRHGVNYVSGQKANPADIQESDMVIDKFVQSFDGSAGKIWRQAILLDVSPEKLNQLADKIAGITRVRREHRLSTIGSIAGLFVLITIVYIFLNAATKGYYAWSLRIVGVVLALILIFLLFT